MQAQNAGPARFASRASRWWFAAIAAGAGAVGALAQAPYGFAPALICMLAAGFVLFRVTETARQAAGLGWCLGAGYFAVSLRWIVEPFQVDAAAHGWMAPFALVLLSGGLALIWATGFAIARRLSPLGWPLALAWSGAELFRGYAFTGFPWANPSQAVLDTLLAAGFEWVGPYGLTCVLCLVVSPLAHVTRLVRAAGVASSVAMAVLLALPYARPPTAMTEHVVRLVQPNAPQDEKWHPDKAHIFVDRQIAQTAAPGTVDLVVWAEMAIPYRASVAAPVFEAAAEAARGANVLMGAMRDDPEGRFFNAALLIGADGEVLQSYDKHHLVPFGEYMPFPAVFRSLGIRALAERTETGFTAGSGPALLDFGDLGQGLMLICYEAVFPQDLRGTVRPDFIVQMTNDAWFGQTIGPQQHLAQARMRAIEQGLPMIRVGGTGISAMIDANGAILASIPLGTIGHLDAHLPEAKAPTPYSRTGDLPVLVILLGGLAFALLRSLRGAFAD